MSIDLTSLPESEAIVIMKGVESGGMFFDEIEVQADDFVSTVAHTAYETIRGMMGGGTPIDVMTVGMAEPSIERWLWERTGLPLHGAHYHANLLHEAGVRRRLLQVAQQIGAAAQHEDVNLLLDRARAGIDSAAGLRKVQTQFLGDMLDEVLLESQTQQLRYATPWYPLTDVLGGGFRPGALYVLAARPGIGKSALALQMASSLAEYGVTGFSSLEMPSGELIRRVIAQGAQISHHLLERGEALPDYATRKIGDWRSRLAPLTLAFDDRSGVTVSDIRAFARNTARHGELSGIVVDYLQLISASDPKKSRLEIITEITRQLKIMARELECPVIALSQLNRDPEKRIDKRPQLSDLRDSGSIEQDADVVMLIYRDPTFEQVNDGPPVPVPLELDVVKNRHGASARVTLYWEGSQMRAYAPGEG